MDYKNLLLKLFKIKRQKSLSDYDKLNLKDMDSVESEIYDFQFVKQANDFSCPDCKVGKLELVVPEIMLNNLKLTECNSCGNRFYKDFSFVLHRISKGEQNDNKN